MVQEHHAKTAIDVGVLFVAAYGYFIESLPTLVAFLSFVWLTIQISQSQRFAQLVSLIGRVCRWLVRRGRI